MNSNAVLHIRHLRRSYQTGQGVIDVLKGANLTVSPGEIVGLIGPSGSGKSSLLHAAGLLERPTGGDILVEGRDCGSLSDAARTKIRLSSIGFVYQFHHLLPEFTAIENVAMPLLIRRMPREQALTQAVEMLKKVGMGHRLEHMPGELSGGERQRAALARALVTRPECILADEPTGNLDRVTANQVFDLLLEINKEQNTSLVVVTHDLGLAAKMQRQYRLEDGKLTLFS